MGDYNYIRLLCDAVIDHVFDDESSPFRKLASDGINVAVGMKRYYNNKWKVHMEVSFGYEELCFGLLKQKLGDIEDYIAVNGFTNLDMAEKL